VHSRPSNNIFWCLQQICPKSVLSMAKLFLDNAAKTYWRLTVAKHLHTINEFALLFHAVSETSWKKKTEQQCQSNYVCRKPKNLITFIISVHTKLIQVISQIWWTKWTTKCLKQNSEYITDLMPQSWKYLANLVSQRDWSWWL